jgi:hypothetical protein
MKTWTGQDRKMPRRGRLAAVAPAKRLRSVEEDGLGFLERGAYGDDVVEARRLDGAFEARRCS